MNTVDYLGQIETLSEDIREKQLELESLFTAATHMTSPTDSERVKSSGKDDRMGDLGTEMVMLKTEIENMMREWNIKRNEIIDQIQKLSKLNYKKVLFMHYVEYKNFSVIAIDLNYSYQWVIEMHKKALNAFESTYGSLYKT